MKIVVQEAQIFGPVSSFAEIFHCDTLYIEKFEHYQKRSFRNRYQIQTANGLDTLSIPLVKGKNNQQLITDVKISYDENWPLKQLQTIRSAYGRSPFFEFYFPDIEKLLYKNHIFLFDLNMDSLCWAISKLKISTNLLYTDHYVKPEQNIKSINSSNSSLFSKFGKGSTSEVKYAQVWENKFEFTSNLSILDLLFCTGPEASIILNKMACTH
jgi:hypothetical protein